MTTPFYDISCEQTKNDNFGGLVIVNSTIINNYFPTTTIASTQFTLADFIFNKSSSDKDDFFEFLLREGVGYNVADTIMVNLMYLADLYASTDHYTIMDNITMELVIHNISWLSLMSEQQAIQESFEIETKLQPASYEKIDSLERRYYYEDTEDIDKSNCAICLDSFFDSQCVLCLPCKHIFCEECGVTWLQNSAKCPLCRYCLM